MLTIMDEDKEQPEQSNTLSENKNLSEREYYIKKGKILERFKEAFFERYMHNALYRQVLEALVRDADPYDIIEKLIEINDTQYKKIIELAEQIPVKLH